MAHRPGLPGSVPGQDRIGQLTPTLSSNMKLSLALRSPGRSQEAQKKLLQRGPVVPGQTICCSGCT